MRPAVSDVETISSVAGTAQIMGVDAGSMSMILSVLSNLYGDPSLAVVREYSSNAIDSHVEAGNPDPILVTSPSQFDPTFVVRDFGVGLSRDDLLNVYAWYGASTKRGCQSKLTKCSDGSCDDCQLADTQIGSFGVGAKSAFAVGSQFVVTAVKDGMQTIALFALNSDGAPTVNILSHQVTLEPNGVKVEVGVRDVQGVQNAIERLFPTWKRGTVLVDGIEPASIWDSLEHLSGSLYLGWRGDRNSQDRAWNVVMGGVPYAVPSAVIASLEMRQRNIIYNVQQSQVKMYLNLPIGSVDITPSREELRVTAKTTATIARMADDFMEAIGSWITSQISDAETVGAALIAFHGLRNKLGNIGNDTLARVTWHGRPLPRALVILPDVEYFTLHSRGYAGGKNARRTKSIKIGPGSYLERYLYVTHVPERRNRSVQLAAKPYLLEQDKNTGIEFVVALPGQPDNHKTDWFDPSDPAFHTITFEAFIKEWKPKPTPSQRGEVKYQVHESFDPFTVDELKAEAKVFYLTYGERYTRLSGSQIVDLTTDGNPVVMLTGTQKSEVFLKRVPGAIHLPQAMREKAIGILDNLSKDDLDALFSKSVLMSVDTSLFNFLLQIRGEITNPVIQEALSIYETATCAQGKDRDRINLLRSAAEHAHRPMPVAPMDQAKLAVLHKVDTGLPLLYAYMKSGRYETTPSPVGRKHVIDYMNSITL